MFKAIAIALFTSLVLANPVIIREQIVPKPKGFQAAPQTAQIYAEDVGCTTTVPTKPDFTHGPTETIWTITQTATRLIDCGSCVAVATAHLPLGPGPAVVFDETVIATTPTTTTVLQCKPTSNIKIAGVKNTNIKQTKAQAKAKAKQAHQSRIQKAKANKAKVKNT